MWRNGTITAAVDRFGKLRMDTFIEEIAVAADLSALASNSDVVVVGSPLRHRTAVSADDRSIFTEFDVKVEETLKGTLAVGDVIAVALPGGRVEFGNGRYAELRVSGFEPMVDGSRYALLLVVNRKVKSNHLVADINRPGVSYGLSLKSEGLFELQGSGTVKPHAREHTPVYQQAVNRDVGAFISELRDVCSKAGKVQPRR